MIPPPIPMHMPIVSGLHNDLLNFCQFSQSLCRRFISRTCVANRSFFSTRSSRRLRTVSLYCEDKHDLIYKCFDVDAQLARNRHQNVTHRLQEFIGEERSSEESSDVTSASNGTVCSSITSVTDVDVVNGGLVHGSVYVGGSLGSGLSGGPPNSPA